MIPPSEAQSLRDAVARDDAREAALEPFAKHGRLYAQWIAEGRAPCPSADLFIAARSALSNKDAGHE